jgi:hypothetical protein
MGDVSQGIKLEFLPYEHQLAYQILSMGDGLQRIQRSYHLRDLPPFGQLGIFTSNPSLTTTLTL